MRWPIVWIIFLREVRDQLRDRRTLFMVLVLPILLYPMLGLGMIKLTEAFEDKPRVVVFVGAEHLPESPPAPPLLNAERDGFSLTLFEDPKNAAKIAVKTVPADSDWGKAEERRRRVREGLADVIVAVPEDISERLAASDSEALEVSYYGANERSQTTFLRVDRLLSRWSKKIGDARLAVENKPLDFAEPVRTKANDVASVEEAGATVWARIFPFLLVMMSLTGAFYPAVDLCAGEKERGTMETLLISPAARAEIVVGKFLTVLLASVATALLNLGSMGLTGLRLAGSLTALRGLGGTRALQPPSMGSAFWMLLLLVPLAAFFSALCVALAVLARSMKEGQYYLTPLYLLAMPLVFITLAPGVELNLFFSLVPVTGVALLLRSLMMGEYRVATQYFLPVVLPTLAYGMIALHWAIDQFQKESVLFREAERFHPGDYLRHLIRERGPKPPGGAVLVCFVTMLTVAWFVALFAPQTPLALVIGQFGYVLCPCLVLTFLLSSDPIGTLRLRKPRWEEVGLAVVLVIAINPLQAEMRPWVEAWFPMPEAIQEALKGLTDSLPNVFTAVLVMAVVPAICEEFAFRGFILSGLESGHSPRSAVLMSALLFGFLHLIVSLSQQLINATLLGLLLGLIAMRSGSIVPGIVFHMLNNGLNVVVGWAAGRPEWRESFGRLYRDPERLLYHQHWLALGAVVTAVTLWSLVRVTRESRNREENARDTEIANFDPGRPLRSAR